MNLIRTCGEAHSQSSGGSDGSDSDGSKSGDNRGGAKDSSDSDNNRGRDSGLETVRQRSRAESMTLLVMSR